MKNEQGNLAAPFPWFGGKSGAVALVWKAFGNIQNYVEPFAGSAAMLLGAPKGKRVETINDADGHVANFWRAITQDPEAVAHHADWPVNETDLFARHSWLVRNKQDLLDKLHGDPDYFDAKTAGWWVWGACAWIGSGWCSGRGPWVHDGEKIVKSKDGEGVARQLPQMTSLGVNRKLPQTEVLGISSRIPSIGGGSRGINRVLSESALAGGGGGAWFAHSGVVYRALRTYARRACDVWRLESCLQRLGHCG